MEESAGNFNVFLTNFDGHLWKQLCMGHIFGLISAWPSIADALAGKGKS
jgi:hypothetical protein